MKFKKTPLFGKDSSLQNTSNVLAFCGALLFWLIFLICMILIEPKPQKPKYKEIKIILTPTFSEEKSDKKNQEREKSQIQNDSEAKSQPERQLVRERPIKTEENFSAEQFSNPEISNAKPNPEVAKNSVKNEIPKNQTRQIQKTEEKSRKTENISPPKENPEPVEYAKSVEELMAEQFAPKSRKKEPDWEEMFREESQFFENDFPQSNQLNEASQSATEIAQSSFSGTAGEAARTQPTARQSESAKKDVQREASVETSNFIKGFFKPFEADYSDEISGQTEIQIEQNGDGRVKLVMSNGKSRSLLEPSEPVISLSENAAREVDGSRSVKIRFTVVQSGNVPGNEITITPASMLPEIVRNEIIAQISKWRFETADYVAFAEFDYKIIKK